MMVIIRQWLATQYGTEVTSTVASFLVAAMSQLQPEKS
jgi:hypothetical protein